jgi:hypothetical protein
VVVSLESRCQSVNVRVSTFIEVFIGAGKRTLKRAPSMERMIIAKTDTTTLWQIDQQVVE